MASIRKKDLEEKISGVKGKLQEFLQTLEEPKSKNEENDHYIELFLDMLVSFSEYKSLLHLYKEYFKPNKAYDQLRGIFENSIENAKEKLRGKLKEPINLTYLYEKISNKYEEFAFITDMIKSIENKNQSGDLSKMDRHSYFSAVLNASEMLTLIGLYEENNKANNDESKENMQSFVNSLEGLIRSVRNSYTQNKENE